MLLLTGATGQVGSALLERLLAAGTPVRCLVRDPRRLGARRVRVQIALGDLADPPSFRNAMRGVDTVVHLAASIRDQPRGSIEELNGIATWRMVRAAERAGCRRFLFFSALDASTHHRARFFRAKALAEQAVRESGMRTTVFAPSIVYAPGDPWLTLLERLALLPVMPVSGRGEALYQPIWTEDAAACVMAALERAEGTAEPGCATGTAEPGRATGTAEPGRANGAAGASERFELAGPQTLSHTDIVRLVLRSRGRNRPLVHVPTPLVSRALRLLESVAGTHAFATWDEAELMEAPMLSERGTADARALGVTPRAMSAILAPASSG
ncbi:MAG TPA: NAD(P)H-binding protein [Solirubrobacteraceae bacterium]|nr:NAD(P)H-binding protein [Solirubrobacteraceae bacterium]